MSTAKLKELYLAHRKAEKQAEAACNEYMEKISPFLDRNKQAKEAYENYLHELLGESKEVDAEDDITAIDRSSFPSP